MDFFGVEFSPCTAPAWARGGHIQTILGHIIPSPRWRAKAERVEIVLPDDDRLVAFWLEGRTETVVYFFHGLGGSTDAGYMHRSARVAHDLGHTVCLVNHRGSGAGAGLAKGFPHSGRAEDLSAAIEFGRSRQPKHRHLAVGFSLSGNALLLLAAGQRGHVLPDAAIAVNAPISLERASVLLTQGVNRLYDMRFVRECRRDVQWRQMYNLVDPKYFVPPFATLREFDNIITAPANGFRDREDYYAQCSAKGHLPRITIPTLMITAEDDPFVDVRDYREAKLSPTTRLHIAETGGHMGYLTPGARGGYERWLDGALKRAIQAG